MFRGRPFRSSMLSTSLGFSVLGTALLLAACGSDDNPAGTNTTPTPIPATPLQPVTSKIDIRPVPLSATGADRLLGVTTAPNGDVFAVGSRTVGSTPDTEIAVAKFDPQGKLVPSFGTLGIASVNVAVGGNGSESARGVGVQSDGKVVVAGVAQHDINATAPFNLDTDVIVARFNTDGTLDTTFGNASPTNGIARLDLSTGVQTGATAVRGDSSWGMVVLPNDKVIVSASKVANVSGRTDTDFAAVQLTANGTLDNAFANTGVAQVDVANSLSQARSLTVQRTGSGPNDYKILVSGYISTIPAAPGITLAVLYRVNADGTFDPTFNGTCAAEAAPCPTGVLAIKYRPAVSEAYDVALQSGDRAVFCGYGDSEVPTSPSFVDATSGRVSSTGVTDTTFGNGGFTLMNVAGFHDRCRALEALSDDSLLLVGSVNQVADNQQAALYLLLPDGHRNTAFNSGGLLPGVLPLEFGGTSDALWGVALSPDRTTAYAVGSKGVATQSPTSNDDAHLVVIPLTPGGQ